MLFLHLAAAPLSVRQPKRWTFKEVCELSPSEQVTGAVWLDPQAVFHSHRSGCAPPSRSLLPAKSTARHQHAQRELGPPGEKLECGQDGIVTFIMSLFPVANTQHSHVSGMVWNKFVTPDFEKVLSPV